MPVGWDLSRWFFLPRRECFLVLLNIKGRRIPPAAHNSRETAQSTRGRLRWILKVPRLPSQEPANPSPTPETVPEA